jgi:ferredoxin-thioredoxin reductase catalytic subunit
MFTIKWANVIAKRLGTKVVDEQPYAFSVLEGLDKTGGYCPCVPKYAHCKDTLCPCKVMREVGHCHCELFKDRK